MDRAGEYCRLMVGFLARFGGILYQRCGYYIVWGNTLERSCLLGQA